MAKMRPGFYVVRMPHKGKGSRLIIESVRFRKASEVNLHHKGIDDEWVRLQVENWCDFVQSQNPKDDVFIIER